MTILFLLVGLGLMILGSDWLVDGASSLAKDAGVSQFVIGLTVIGFGTSCPELVVSLKGAIVGNADIAIGNVIGSNIFNVLFVLGVTALVLPVGITERNRLRDIPMALAITSMMCFGEISRLQGMLMLGFFIFYMYFNFKSATPEATDAEVTTADRSLPVSLCLVIFGLVCLILGGNLFVDKATDLARALGVTDKFIAVTILAGGTSLPELAASITATVKGRPQMAIGNILGSNVFNILLIAGMSSVISPVPRNVVSGPDIVALLGSMFLLLLCTYTGNRNTIGRVDGALMLLCLVIYYVFHFIQS